MDSRGSRATVFAVSVFTAGAVFSVALLSLARVLSTSALSRLGGRSRMLPGSLSGSPVLVPVAMPPCVSVSGLAAGVLVAKKLPTLVFFFVQVCVHHVERVARRLDLAVFRGRLPRRRRVPLLCFRSKWRAFWYRFRSVLRLVLCPKVDVLWRHCPLLIGPILGFALPPAQLL